MSGGWEIHRVIKGCGCELCENNQLAAPSPALTRSHDELRIPRDGNGVAKDPGNLSDYQRGYIDGFDAPRNVEARALLLAGDKAEAPLDELPHFGQQIVSTFWGPDE